MQLRVCRAGKILPGCCIASQPDPSKIFTQIGAHAAMCAGLAACPCTTHQTHCASLDGSGCSGQHLCPGSGCRVADVSLRHSVFGRSSAARRDGGQRYSAVAGSSLCKHQQSVSWQYLTLRRGQLRVPRPAAGGEGGDEAAAWRGEVAIVERVISHLITKDNVLVVVDMPEVRPHSLELHMQHRTSGADGHSQTCSPAAFVDVAVHSIHCAGWTAETGHADQFL